MFLFKSNAFSLRMGVALLHLPNGLDFSHLNPNIICTEQIFDNLNNDEIIKNKGYINPLMSPASICEHDSTPELHHIDSNLSFNEIESVNSTFTIPQLPPMSNQQHKDENLDAVTYLTKNGSNVPRDILDALNIFNRKQLKGTIDVFWLYDDGGNKKKINFI